MSHVLTGARYLLGVALFVLGLNGFLGFIPQPPPPTAGGEFLGALASGGVLPVVKAFEVIIGALLLAGRWVPLALVMLVPISVGIVLYHAMFDVGGGVAAYLVAVLNAVLLWQYRRPLLPLLTARAEPAALASTPRATVG